ncbi:MAG: hypothetical protein NEA02_06635, partial [Thermoanaerobaculia bacterium]|nr:hypothetical protein [Thermoanaerobaculia bacterium]
MPEIQTSMSDYIKGHAGLKYIFFGGKGGVGKTVFAAATAVHNAQLGRRTILASTNPVHSLSSLLGMSKVYDEWINKVTKLREDMREYEEMVSR